MIIVIIIIATRTTTIAGENIFMNRNRFPTKSSVLPYYRKHITKVIYCAHAYCDGYTRSLAQALPILLVVFFTCLNTFFLLSSVARMSKRMTFQEISSLPAHKVAHWNCPCSRPFQLADFLD